MLKEPILVVLLVFVWTQLTKAQTTTSYWGFDNGEQTTTQNWWGENVDTGEVAEVVNPAPDTTPGTPPSSPQVAAAGVVPVGAGDGTETTVAPADSPAAYGAAATPDAPPADGANSTASAISSNMLWIPVMGLIVLN
ncbi:unnamed protein product [Bursaphelenchus okinawaensis]|uniref:Uncharacterized protein n=1 Tax=Bursaphelenchus okinawaensis TaxID=465554 RepID=A0A811KXU3_9BILA|nr:unnamed protein product [Bursaphelenchus okinawaensis]CAG9112796.1 unnamed protein product [Bursaphelenchus okinawaensis]